jgi:hypothetical protein
VFQPAHQATASPSANATASSEEDVQVSEAFGDAIGERIRGRETASLYFYLSTSFTLMP